MEFNQFLTILDKLGITQLPGWVVPLLAFGGFMWLAAWRLRGHIDHGQISGLKAQLDAAQERIAVKEERLAHSKDIQEELSQSLTAATEASAQLRKQITLFLRPGEPSDAKVAETLVVTLGAMQLDLQSATNWAKSLGSSLAGPEPTLYQLDRDSQPIHRGNQFTTFGPTRYKPEITASSEGKS